MLFYLGALVGMLLRPSALLIIALCLGLVWMLRRPMAKGARRLAIGAVVLLLACGFLPIGNALILPLENRFKAPTVATLPNDVTGIIMLGGFEDGWVTAGRQGLGLNEAAERLTEGVRWAQRFPKAKIVFTGGVAEFVASHNGAAGPVGEYLEEMGLSADRIVLEANARNTYENAVLTRDLVKPQPGQTWLLITSAYHVPRSVGTFRKAGFFVRAVPVDYRTRGLQDLLRTFKNLPAGLARVDVAAREWLGLVAYWLAGRTSELVPAPLHGADNQS